ncbi:hypothetical protein ACGFIR_31095 [Micromonospora sp. NPDC049051]|uniref:hypothetical protein n=1 Tax=Micromonospora sp. NPDC049051 TaxID=3364264 RepID=UPI0037170559
MSTGASLSQLDRITNDLATEDTETPTKWWIAAVPEDNRPRAGFVEDVEEVIGVPALAG